MGIPKWVVICTDAHWGTVTKEDYEESAESLRQLIEGLEVEQNDKAEKLAIVDIVDTQAAVKKILRESPLNEAVDILIFLSRGAISEARAIKRQYKHLRVVVLTGLIPEDEVVILSKSWTRVGFLKDLIRFS